MLSVAGWPMDQMRKGRVAVTTYHVTARRSEKWWTLQCVEVPGVRSQVKRLKGASDFIREAIEWVTGDHSDFEVVVSPELPAEFEAEQQAARDARLVAEQARREAAAHSRRAARVLADLGLTVREIGTLMGVSYQRAAQLLSG